MNARRAHAKINLALVVGPIREDGKHEVATVYQQVALFDRISIEPSDELSVTGFDGDTIARAALVSLAAAAGVEPRWRVHVEKRVPVAAGLGGGSSDAATALRLANEMLERPLSHPQLQQLAVSVGADVPFFLCSGPQLGTGDGTTLDPLDLPQDYWVLLALPDDVSKASTADVYRSFDDRGGERGFEERRTLLHRALAEVRNARDLASLPRNDLTSSPLAHELEREGAFRADVSGAGPTIYALFDRRAPAEAARRRLEPVARVWMTAPAWYV